MHHSQLGLMARRVALGVSTVLLLTLMTVSPAAAQAPPMRFGADIDALGRAQAEGLPLSYGTLWLGAWTQRHGWGYAQQQLQAANATNVTPVINWWYWGDDISPACVEQGCQDARQGVFKDKATWYRMSRELAALIAQVRGGRETVVIVETEFNKGGIETHEPFDGYLAELAGIFHTAPNVKVVVGFGNWGREHWTRFDRATAASDALGMQLMRSALREPASYGTAIATLVASARYLQALFNKPTMVTDLALSSFPSASHEAVQAQVVGELFLRMQELKNAGVQSVLYRMVVDDPSFDTSNYHGEAERHWGLLRADGSRKPAFAVFANGVRQEAGDGGATSPGCTAPGAPQHFTFTVQGGLVTLQWSAPQAGGAPASYIIEAGSASGLSNLAVAPVGGTSARVQAPAGTYFVRIKSRNACGVSGASNEQVVRVG